MHLGEPLFAQYEAAVDAFLRAGGHTPSVIRSPPALLKQYRLEFEGSSEYAHGVRIEEAAQNFISVRGATIAGHHFEWPEPA